ncbi:RING-H2 finger protein ATL78 [Linum perenne]
MPRRLLVNSPFHHPSPPPSSSSSSPPPPPAATDSTFDANVVMVLSVLLCALICSLGLNSIIRCALRCSHLVPTGAARLANTGIKKKALKTFPVVTFSSSSSSSDVDGTMKLDAECVICLSEFATGDRVKILPKCNHGFHVKCVDKWLGSHSSCPTCRHCLIETCRKIVGAPTPQVMVAPAEAVVICMPPLEQEDLVRSYRGASS